MEVNFNLKYEKELIIRYPVECATRMVSTKRRSKRPQLLSHSRPPTVKAKQAALSSKATRNLIRSHHQLVKARAQALQTGDEALANELDAQIQAKGGLESYQLASKLGQSSDRGGDSSKVLVDWLGPKFTESIETSRKLRVLEVGALSSRNACSRHRALDVTRIDLNAQEPGILKQNFMQRPLPRSDEDCFDIISVSLVLNYVPDAVARGEMLKRCVAFLTKGSPAKFVPSLFLVLPVACVNNSRYLTEERLHDILSSMGFTLANNKQTSKLVFQLWEHANDYKPRPFKKEMLNPGKTRNNFAIIVQDKDDTTHLEG